MVPDVGLSLSAWGDIFVGASHGVRFLPFFRIMRMLRLARLARLQVVLNSLMDTNSVMLNLIISIVKSICAIILLVHVIACVWVGIGRVDEEARVLCQLGGLLCVGGKINGWGCSPRCSSSARACPGSSASECSPPCPDSAGARRRRQWAASAGTPALLQGGKS